MGTSNSDENNIEYKLNRERDSDVDPPLIRRRRNAVHSVNTVHDPLTKTDMSEFENLSTDSATDSGLETNSDDDNRGKIENVDALKDTASSSTIEDDRHEKTDKGQGQDLDPPLKYSFRPCAPAHRRIKESPLSSKAIFKQSHAGLFNLCIVVLVAVNSRLIVENLMKYGLLIRTGFWFSSKSLRDWPLFMCCLSLPIFPLGAFVVEKLAHQKSISEPIVVSLHVIITTAAILYPVFVILRCDSAVQSGVILMIFACIGWLKLVSYAHTSYDMRALAKSVDKVDVMLNSSSTNCVYDVNFKSLAYFMLAPTLCYQTDYPRTTCIRKGWVIRQFIKLLIFTGLMGFIVEQYINPIVQNSKHPLKGDLLNAIERVLKLSVPTLYVWLCMFYCFFHLWLNILAELLCFGDREFYKNWWNAETIGDYWRMWNMPVHKWMIRHVYMPCLQNGIPKGVAILIAFFISAVFHEIWIAVPCHLFKFWAFLGIMFQVPLVILTNFLQNKFRNPMVGNMIFWFFFSILGQPMCILLYYHDLMNQKAKPE